jgi:acyl CoA:acetate/3-ketoacid CoA transferase alpha subunit
LVHGAEMRVAETRAVNRALRKAYGIGLCSVEELGAPRSYDSGSFDQRKFPANGNNGHQNGQPRLRDRLCLLIRQYKLDAGLVKAYAADYCGTATLREATRDLVEAFINDLALRAAKDREGLICQLNSYAKSEAAP